jgi:predicted ABC-type ATPase
MKKFIAVIGVAGAGKTTFIEKHYKHLPMQELNDDTHETSLLFHPLEKFDEAVLHITAFEEVVGEFLAEEILSKVHELHIAYIKLKDNGMQKERLRERAMKIGEHYDVHEYAYSKNVFERTEKTIIAFSEKYKNKLSSFKIIENY